MNRRKFLTTTSGSLALGQFLSAKPQSLTGKIKKAVKFGAKPNDQKMQNLKVCMMRKVFFGVLLRPFLINCRNIFRTKTGERPDRIAVFIIK